MMVAAMGMAAVEMGEGGEVVEMGMAVVEMAVALAMVVEVTEVVEVVGLAHRDRHACRNIQSQWFRPH